MLTKRATCHTILAIGLSLGLNTAAYSQEDRFASVEIIPTQLTEHIYLFTGSGGNIGVSTGDDGLLIIDDQFAPLADKISEQLTKLQPSAPKYIINTHYHGDHTGGNAHFGKNGTIIAHHNVLKRLASDSKTPKQALPVITYSEHISVHFNEDSLNLLHLGQGHTDGDTVVIWQNANVVHMGDLFFKDRFPFIDLKGGGDVIGYRDNVAEVLKRIDDNVQVIPGHGDLATKNDLYRFKHMLDDSINWMTDQLVNGKSLDEIKNDGFITKYQDWSWGFINTNKWIETLYNGLKK